MACSTRDATTSEQPQNTMKLFYTVIFFSLLASAAFAREESILARVTSYWAGEGSKFASTGQRLHSGHCAVDPKRIPYGSKVVFPDRACTAVDTGPAVISRKAARLCGRTDRKSTRLNSSHRCISYSVFCLKKKKTVKTGIKGT